MDLKLFEKDEIEPAIDYLFDKQYVKALQFDKELNLPKSVIYQAGRNIFGKSVVQIANAVKIQDTCLDSVIPSILAILKHSGIDCGFMLMSLASIATNMVLADMKRPDFEPMKAFNEDKIWNPNFDPKDGYKNAFNPYISLARANIFIDISKEFANTHVSFMRYLLNSSDGDLEQTIHKIYQLKPGEVGRIYFNLLPAFDYTNISRIVDMVEEFA